MSSIATLSLLLFVSEFEAYCDPSGKIANATSRSESMAWLIFIQKCPSVSATSLQSPVRFRVKQGMPNVPAKSHSTHQIKIIGRIDTVLAYTQVTGKPTHVFL